MYVVRRRLRLVLQLLVQGQCYVVALNSKYTRALYVVWRRMRLVLQLLLQGQCPCMFTTKSH